MKYSRSPGPRPGAAKLAAPLFATALMFGLIGSSVEAAPYSGSAGGYELDVAQGKSQVLQTPGNYTDLMVGDPKVADVVPLTTHSVYVVGKGVGQTALSIYGPHKRLIAEINVVVGPDIQTLQNRVHEMMPEERDVQFRSSNGSLILSGTVKDPVEVHQLATLAESFDPGKVINMLGVEGTQEVQLEVRFVEMQRTVAKALNVSINRTSLTGNPQFSFNSGSANLGGVGGLIGTAGSIGLTFLTPDGSLNVTLDALESKGVVKTLAEPTLVAMSGETASFLAGGEVPVPAPQSNNGLTGGNIITVAYHTFGISLGFTPTILADGMIDLVVKPEVSSVDPANGIEEQGIKIPAFKVRRANTTVELRDGESFTIAGLLSDNYSNTVSAFPILGDIPVLGALFRSPNFQHDQTELVIVVTPHLVVARRGPVALPTDHFTPPSDYELFLFGMLAGQGAQMRPEDRALMSRDPNKGGVEGPYGHVLY